MRKHAFIYNSHFKPFHKPKRCGDLIDNKSDAPIYIIDDNDR